MSKTGFRSPSARNRKNSSGRGERGLSVRVKTARGRKISSTRWLERQLNDPYVKMAKLDGLRGRAAYKIREIDDRLQFLTQGKHVVDLGAAPGGWSQIAADRVNSHGRNPKKRMGKVLGVDIQEIEPLEGVEFLTLDFLQDDADEIVKSHLEGNVDVVLSDMAPFTTGHKATDHLKIMALVEAAAHFAVDILSDEGIFIAKVFDGGATSEIMQYLKFYFTKTIHIKPEASRKDSSERFLVATGFQAAKRDLKANEQDPI